MMRHRAALRRGASENALRSPTEAFRLQGEAGRQLMYIVYVLRSRHYPGRVYVGYTTDLTQRLAQHNRGGSLYTKRFSPWDVEVTISFKNQTLAKNFETYLKSGSGHAFLHKRLIA